MPLRLANGPVPNRSVTDIAFCVCFLVFFLAWVVIGVLYCIKGKVGNFDNLLDSEGNQCGIDGNVRDYPYLYMLKFDADYKSYCVKSCPAFDYNQIKYNSTGMNITAIKPLYYEDLGSVGGSNYYTQDQYNAYLSRISTPCFPNKDVPFCTNNPSQNINLYDSRKSFSGLCIPLDPNLAVVATVIDTKSGSWVNDLNVARWYFLIAIGSALVISLLFLFLSTFIMGFLIWLQIAFAIFFTAALSVVLFILAFGNQTDALNNNDVNPATIRAYQNIRRYKWWYFSFGLVFAFLFIGLIVYVTLNFRRILSSIEILKFGNQRLLRNPMLLLLSLFIFILQVVFFLLGLFFIFSCYTSGNLEKNTQKGAPYPDYSLGVVGWFGIVFLIVSGLWIFVFINNLGDYMTSAVTCADYFKTGGCFGAVCNTIVYHVGSIALASLVLFPCALIRLIYAPIYDLITKSGNEKGPPNLFQRVASIVCICFKWPYKKFIMRTGEHGFPMGYIASCNFCPATKEAYYLQEAYSETLADIGLINFIYRFTAVIAIASLNTLAAGLFFSYLEYYQNRLIAPIIPTIVRKY